MGVLISGGSLPYHRHTSRDDLSAFDPTYKEKGGPSWARGAEELFAAFWNPYASLYGLEHRKDSTSVSIEALRQDTVDKLIPVLHSAHLELNSVRMYHDMLTEFDWAIANEYGILTLRGNIMIASPAIEARTMVMPIALDHNFTAPQYPEQVVAQISKAIGFLQAMAEDYINARKELTYAY